MPSENRVSQIVLSHTPQSAKKIATIQRKIVAGQEPVSGMGWLSELMGYSSGFSP
jgi:hypothetical protein